MYRLSAATPPTGSARSSSNSSKNEIAEMILGVPLFQDLDWKEAELFARFCKYYEMSEGTLIFKEGDRGDFMVLIVEGAVEISKATQPLNSVKIAAEGMGRIIGEMALVDGEPRSATVRCSRASKVLVISSENFHELRMSQPKLGATILSRLCRLLSQRLRRTTGLLSEHMDQSRSK